MNVLSGVQGLAAPPRAHSAASPPHLIAMRASGRNLPPSSARPALQFTANPRSARRPARRSQTTTPRASLDAALGLITDTPLRDVLAFAGSVVGAKLLVAIFEQLESSGVIDKNLSRKAVHTLAGPLFLVCWPLFSSAPYAQYLAALVPSLNGLRLLLVGSGAVSNPRAVAALSRTGDPAELLRGPLYYVVVLLAVTALCWRGSPVGVLVVALMCGGDGLADIVGRRWGGTNRLPWNPEKSWAGSAAMFGGGLATAAALLTYFSALGYIAVDVPSAVTALVAVSAAATAIESLPMNKVLDDNLSVPGVAAVLGAAMLQAVVVL